MRINILSWKISNLPHRRILVARTAMKARLDATARVLVNPFFWTHVAHLRILKRMRLTFEESHNMSEANIHAGYIYHEDAR